MRRVLYDATSRAATAAAALLRARFDVAPLPASTDLAAVGPAVVLVARGAVDRRWAEVPVRLLGIVDAGATGVHIMDSAGALTMEDVKARIGAMLRELGGEAEAGIHAHQNLSLAVANTVVAFQEGATLADACLAGAGAGAGNCQMEALVAVLQKLGIETGIDLWALEDVADAIVRPILTTPPTVDRVTLTQGFAGVPGSFLHHAARAAERFGVDARDLLVEVGRRRSVGGQEDLLLEVAAGMAAERPAAG